MATRPKTKPKSNARSGNPKGPSPLARSKAVKQLPAAHSVPALVPPAGLIAGSNSPDALLGLLLQANVLLYVGATKVLRNPDPILRERAGGLNLRVYEDMLDKDGHMSGVVETRINATTGLPREIQPGDESAEAESIAAMVQDAFDRWHSFDEDTQALMMALVYGYRPAEVEWVIWDDGLVGVKKLHDRDPDGFVFDADWKLRMRVIERPIEGNELPDRKFIVLSYQPRANNPYGHGLGRALWWLGWAKRNGLRSWLIANEKFGVPTLDISHPQNLNKKKRQDLIDAGAKVQTDTVLAHTDDITVKLLESMRGGTTGHHDMLTYLDDQVSKRVLGQTMTADAKNTGLNSRAPLEAAKVRQDILERDALWVANLYTATIIRWIVEFNLGPQPDNLYPKLFINAQPASDLLTLAQRDEILIGLGLPISTEYMYETYSIPVPASGEELINDLMAAAAQASMPLGLDPSGFGGSGGGPPKPKIAGA
jgi:phage gp29-like protein